MSEPIAKCCCGRTFTPMEWVELRCLEPIGSRRRCPCGLNAVRVIPVTLAEIERLYKKALEEE